MVIEDGKGKGHLAEVNAEQELVVRAITEPEIEHASGTLGTAYSWDSTELDLGTGETFLFIKNNDDTPLIFDTLEINGSNVVCTWTVLLGTATTTPAGTTVNSVNCNTGHLTKSATVTAISDETAVADGSLIKRLKTAISGYQNIDMAGVILEKGGYIQVNQITESTSGSVILTGHFENPS